MSSVATQFPARTDSNGNTWYRPVRDKGMAHDQWGWTSNPAMADPSYAQDVTLCAIGDVTAGDRAAILDFAAALAAKAKAAATETESGCTAEPVVVTCANAASATCSPAVTGTESDPLVPVLPATVPGWLPAWTVHQDCV